MTERDMPSTNEIGMFMHCGKCLGEYKSDPKLRETMSPRDYAQTETGFTKLGIQVWCKRHECNIVHIDFEGQKHPANTTAQK